MANGELRRRAETEIKKHGNLNKLSVAIGENPGVIWRVLKGGNSPTLRRLWKVPKHPPRSRLIIETDAETIARFDSICAAEGVTRRDLLAWVVKNYDEFLIFFHSPGDCAELPY